MKKVKQFMVHGSWFMVQTVVILLLVLSTIYYLPSTIFADTQDIEEVFGQVVPPPSIDAIGRGSEGINNVLNKFVLLAYTISAIVFVFMVIYSAFQWITSGGDKEAVGNARKRLTYAILGIVLLSLAFLIMRVLGAITGFTFFTGQEASPL